MGRWAQAARRSGAIGAKEVGEMPEMAPWTQFGSYWQANVTCSTNPVSFQVEVQQDDGGGWEYYETLAFAGVGRSQVSTSTYDDVPTRGKVRAHWPDGWSAWSDWLEAVVP